MEWFKDLLWNESTAHTIFVYSLIVAAGLALGKIRIMGVSLGIVFVLFVGILMGHIGFSVNHEVIEFIKDFGLILFVFSIGLQVGPGFFSSFRKGGLTLNILAIVFVFLGGLTTLALHFITGTSVPMLAGIMSGAVTNTPGLGAAQNAFAQISGESGGSAIPEISLGYAVAYPFGVLGIILTMVILRKAFGIDIRQELEKYRKELHPDDVLPEKVNIVVTNPLVFNKTVAEISSLAGHGLVISRVLQNGELITPVSSTIIHENDIILIVTQKGMVDEIVRKIGAMSNMDLSDKKGNLVSRRVVVTNKNLTGKTLGSLRLRGRYNINITRVYRSGIEFVASPQVRLQLGDALTIVGDEKSIEKVAGELGNSLKRLEEPNLIPIYIGILAGVILGSIPVAVPGLANPLKLGLAGGPLIIAILMSNYGYRFSLVSYTTVSANLMLRETGIVLFLASVGISAGEKFIPALASGDGFKWMAYGAIITLLPLIAVGFYSRLVLKRNYFEICGFLSGSMTDPPALAYANSIADSEAPAVAYATVYPLVMFLRIFIAQLLIILFA